MFKEFVPILDQRCSLHSLTKKPLLWQRLSTQFLPVTCLVCTHRVCSPNLPLCHLCDRERLIAPWLTSPVELSIAAITGKKPSVSLKNWEDEGSQFLRMYVQWHYSPFVRYMLHRAKFSPTRKLFSFLGIHLNATFKILYPHLFETQKFPPLLVPIPPSERHYRERLFNQALLVARELSFGSVADLLLRDSRSLPQSSLNSKQRSSNMHPALSVKSAFRGRIRGQNIILIDDIVGSGNTMCAARNLLVEHGASSVEGVALAISPLFRH